MSENPYRLPRDVVPRRYELRLEPDLDSATFTGEVAIDVRVAEPVRRIVLNAVELDLRAGSVTFDGTEIPCEVAVDVDHERVTLELPETVPAGNATLRIAFGGTLNDKLRGFYRSTYTDDTGARRTIATTQFESTDARRAFPCFDEPDFKATFAVTLIVAEGLLAVANGEEIERRATADGRVLFRFAETMLMSTYLVAFVVGPLETTEALDVDGVAVRIVHQPGRSHLTSYALDVAAFSLRYFTGYYGLAYPAAKLDLVALPDFAFGAMENLGCVTFREALLLVDPASVSKGELGTVADVIAHEIAHMWFGDLVTMRWWNGIWLNEAFATFMEVAAVDAFRPEWRRWTEFSLERSTAFDVDALDSTRPVEYEVESPADAEGMFDVLTYQKGGSLLRMLEQFLGPETFREGIRRYLADHRYANTETEDLWDAIGSTSDAPVRSMMDSWIFQGGHPLLTVGLNEDGTTLAVGQERFRYQSGDSEAVWTVPVIVRAQSVDGAGTREYRLLLSGATAELSLDEPADSVIANAGAHGFYRVRYLGDMRSRLLATPGLLSPVERYTLVDDAYAATVAGAGTAGEFFELARAMGTETDLDVWRVLVRHLAELIRVIDDTDDNDAGYRRFVGGLIHPLLERLGWTPADGEDARTSELRGLAIRASGVVAGEESTGRRCREIHDAHVAGTTMDPEVVAAATAVVAHFGTAADHEMFESRAREAPTPQEQLRYLYGMAEFPDPELVLRACAMTLDGRVRSQNAPFLVARALQNRRSATFAWEFVRDHWDELNDLVASNLVVRMLSGIRVLSRPEVAGDVGAFFDGHPLTQGNLQLAQHLEKMWVNAALRERAQTEGPDGLLSADRES